MRIIYVNCGLGNKSKSDLRRNEHFLSSPESKAWKNFKPVRDLNPWLLLYWSSALPTELTNQRGAGRYVGS